MSPSQSRPSVRPVVLAGGGSTRFDDGHKAFATLGRRSLLERVLTTVAASTGSDPIVAVQDRHQRRRIETEVTAELTVEPSFVTDDPAFRGPLAGLYAACAHLDASWLFLVGCDMPLVDDEAVSWLLDRYREPGADLVVPETDRGIEPLHALYRRDAVLMARERVEVGDGLRVLLDALDDITVVPSEDCPYDLDRSARNVNTVSDLETLRAQCSDPQ